MDISHAANYFNTLLLDVWDSTLTGDPWVTSNRPSGRLLASDREQAYSTSPRWRTLLVQTPLRAKAIRVGGITGQVYLVGNPDTNYDSSRYSLAYPVYRADTFAWVYEQTSAPVIESDSLARPATRSSTDTVAYPCGLDRSGTVTSSLFDEVRFTEATIILPDVAGVSALTVKHELRVTDAFYAVRETYKANGFTVVKAMRKKQ